MFQSLLEVLKQIRTLELLGMKTRLVEIKLEQQNRDVANLQKAFETLQKQYVERMTAVESELRKTKHCMKNAFNLP